MSQTEKAPPSGTDRDQGAVLITEEWFLLKEISSVATFQHDVTENLKEESVKLSAFKRAKHERERERETFIRADPHRHTGSMWTQ
jgi:hypothetical protein